MFSQQQKIYYGPYDHHQMAFFPPCMKRRNYIIDSKRVHAEAGSFGHKQENELKNLLSFTSFFQCVLLQRKFMHVCCVQSEKY